MGAKKWNNVITNNVIPPKNNPNEIGSMDQPDFGLKRFSSMKLVVAFASDMDFTFIKKSPDQVVSIWYHIDTILSIEFLLFMPSEVIIMH